MPRTVHEIIGQAEELARQFEAFEPDPAAREDAEALAVVHRAVLRRAEAEAELAEAVSQARSKRVSWDVLGRFLGTTGEAARQRYSRTPVNRRARQPKTSSRA